MRINTEFINQVINCEKIIGLPAAGTEGKTNEMLILVLET